MKLVKSYRDETWKLLYDSTADDWYSETEVNAYSRQLGENENKRATYAYRLSIDLGSGASDILFSDVLESAENSEWKGTLNSIDFSYAAGLGLVPSVYYSTEEITYSEIRQSNGTWVNNLDEYTADTAQEWNGNIWTAPVDEIRSIVVRFSTAGLKDGVISKKQVYFIVNMTAPELTPKEIDEFRFPLGKKTINNHTVYYMSRNLNTRIRLDSKNATVKLLPAVVLIKMIKKDGENGKVLTGAEFSFFTDSKGTQPVIDWEGNVTAQNVKLNNFGELLVDTLEPGTYWYRETVPPVGYHLDTTLRKIDLERYDISYIENDRYIIENDRLTGRIVFTKKDADDEYVEGIPGAVYALFDANGISVFTDENNAYQETGGTKTEFTTDNNGQIIITDLPWGILVDGVKVHPTFLYESIWCLLLFIALSWFNNNKRYANGQTVALYFIFYSLERFFVESLRTDSLMIGPFKQAQVISLCAIILGIFLYRYASVHKRIETPDKQ